MADLGAIGAALGNNIVNMQNIYGFPESNPSNEFSGIEETTPSHIYVATYAQVRTYPDTYLAPSAIPANGTIVGRVYYDNAPQANVPVHLFFTLTNAQINLERTDADGYFAFYGLEKDLANGYYIVAPGSTHGQIKVSVTADANVEIGLFSVTARRPLVLINGQITEAPDGTTWAVGVPASPVSTYSANVGDGSNTSYTVTHNLGTKDIVVEVLDNNSPYGVVDVSWEATTTNSITVIFDSAPSSNRYRVNIIGIV